MTRGLVRISVSHHGQIVNPVGIDLVGGVVIRRIVEAVRVPCNIKESAVLKVNDDETRLRVMKRIATRSHTWCASGIEEPDLPLRQKRRNASEQVAIATKAQLRPTKFRGLAASDSRRHALSLATFLERILKDGKWLSRIMGRTTNNNAPLFLTACFEDRLGKISP